jgi:hypothetical protein
MISDVFLEKIKENHFNNEIEQKNILLELIQQFILVSLAKANFFVDAQFHGGTCLLGGCRKTLCELISSNSQFKV